MDVDGEVCAVCGDTNAKMHYGKMACYGCKGFFRRTIKDKHRYICRYDRQCVVDKQQRNACRYCRFRRCLAVGMDPNAVQPDRDVTGKQRSPRIKKVESASRLSTQEDGADWTMRLPLDVRSLMMHLMNIEAQVVRGELSPTSPDCPPTKNRKGTLRDIFEHHEMFPNERYEMRHEPNRMATMEDLKASGRRAVFATADWLESFTELIDLEYTEDKIALLKASFGPLFLFNLAARTAQNNPDGDSEILCLSCCSYVPRMLPSHFTETNHLANNLIGKIIDQLVNPIRKMQLSEQEIVAFKAIILLNPEATALSYNAAKSVELLRDRAQEALFQVIRGLHPTSTASSRFGHLLFLMPTLSTLTALMSENVQLANAFNELHTGPMLAEIFGDFTLDVDFLQDLQLEEMALPLHRVSSSQMMTDECTQTDDDDGSVGGGCVGGGGSGADMLMCQSQSGSDMSMYDGMDNDFDAFDPSPAPLHLGCGQLFALINDIDPVSSFHLL